MTWTNEDDAMMRESMRVIQEHEDAIGALNEAVLHEPEPAEELTAEQLADQIFTLSVRNAVLESAAENWCNFSRENFRRFKKYRCLFYIALAVLVTSHVVRSVL